MALRGRRAFFLLATLLLSLALLIGLGRGWLSRGPKGGAQALAALASPETSRIRLYNLGSGTASLLVDYYDQEGELVLKGKPVALPAGGGLTLDLKENPQLPQGFRGSAVVSSSQPLATLLLKDFGGASPAHALTGGVERGFPRLYIPLIMRGYGNPSQTSRFIIQNLGDKTACLALTYWSEDGQWVYRDVPEPSTPCPQGGLPLEPRASLLSDQATEGFLKAPFLGGVVVEALPGADGVRAPLAAIAEITAAKRAAAYTALGYDFNPTATTDDVAATTFLPLLYRRFGGWSSLVQIQRVNIESDQPLPVTVAFYPYGSSTPLLIKSLRLLRFQALDLLGEEELPEGFVGSAVIKSSEPLAVVVVLRSLPTNGFAYTAYTGLAIDKAATALAVPLVYKNYGGPQADPQGQSSSLSFQVADGGEAQVTVTFHLDGSDRVFTSRPFSVRGSLTLSLRSPLFLLPDNFIGTAQVTASKPIVLVVHDWAGLAPNDTSGSYNALSP